jgi:hypothetical protein
VFQESFHYGGHHESGTREEAGAPKQHVRDVDVPRAFRPEAPHIDGNAIADRSRSVVWPQISGFTQARD